MIWELNHALFVFQMSRYGHMKEIPKNVKKNAIKEANDCLKGID